MKVEQFLRRAVDVASDAGLSAPSIGRLRSVRKKAADYIVGAYRSEAETLVRASLSGDRQSREALALLAEDALAEMRHRVLSQSSRHGGVERSLAESDRFWLAPELDEYLDDPDFDE